MRTSRLERGCSSCRASQELLRITTLLLAFLGGILAEASALVDPPFLCVGSQTPVDEGCSIPNTVGVVLTVWKRDSLGMQLDAVASQTLRPAQVHICQSEQHVDVSGLVRKFREDHTDIEVHHTISSQKTLYGPGRFHVAYQMGTEHVSVWDEDIVPSSDFLLLAVDYSLANSDALVGGISRSLKELKDSEDAELKEWGGDVDITAEGSVVDFVGHFWTLRREHLRYFLGERQLTYATGEDMQLAFSLQKRGIESRQIPFGREGGLDGEPGVPYRVMSTDKYSTSSEMRNRNLRQRLICQLLLDGFRPPGCSNCGDLKLASRCVEHFHREIMIAREADGHDTTAPRALGAWRRQYQLSKEGSAERGGTATAQPLQHPSVSSRPADRARQKVSLLHQPAPNVNISSSGTGKRAIFCATPGHTGTHLLADMLSLFSNTISEHEPEPRMLLDKFKGALPETRPMREKEKLGHILEVLRKVTNKTTVYAEMSNMFIKTFWDLDWYSHFDTVHIIILRRWGPAVVKAHVNLGLGDERFRDRTAWVQYTETIGLADAAIPWPAKPYENSESVTRMMYYVFDIEERVQRLRQQLAGKVKFVEVSYEKLVEADPAYLNWVFVELGYTVTVENLADLKSTILPKPPAVVRISTPVSEEECLNAMWHYMAVYKPEISQQGLQSLMRHPTASPDIKIIAVAQVWQASEYIAEWLRLVLQYCDSVVLIDDASDDNTVSIAEAFSTSVTVLKKKQWSFQEYSAYMLLLREAIRLGATHIVCLDTDEVITANTAQYTRALIMSLPSNTNAAAHLWLVWDGITDMIQSAGHWHTVQETSFAYRLPMREKDQLDWSNKGTHHIGRLPDSVQETSIKLMDSVGGMLHFKYANLRAYKLKIDWYKLMEWREVKAKKSRQHGRLESLSALHSFYESKWPQEPRAIMKIPQEWILNLQLEPFQMQKVTRRAREQKIKDWIPEFSSDELHALGVNAHNIESQLLCNSTILHQKEAALQNHYDKNPKYFFQGDLIKFYDKMWESFPLLPPPHTWTTVLDLGCGDGRLGEYWSEKFPERPLVMYGVDYSAVRIEIALKRSASWNNIEATFSCGDLNYKLQELAQTGRKFDVVTAFEVLEHLVDPKKVIQMCRGLLNDHGVMIASVPKSMPNVAHLQVYNGEDDVQKELAPDFIGEDRSRVVHNARREGFALLWHAVASGT